MVNTKRLCEIYDLTFDEGGGGKKPKIIKKQKPFSARANFPVYPPSQKKNFPPRHIFGEKKGGV